MNLLKPNSIVVVVFLIVFSSTVYAAAWFPIGISGHIGTFNCSIDEPIEPAYEQWETVRFNSSVTGATTPCMYSWISSIDDDILFRDSGQRNDLSVGKHYIQLRVSDAETDTQIPAFPLIEEETKTIESNIRINISDHNNCDTRIIDSDMGFYGPPITTDPYRCADTPANRKDPCFYRLFKQNKTWIKIFTINPLVEDPRMERGVNGSLYTRTSTPDRDRPSYEPVPIKIYIGAGCERVDARFFDETDANYVARAAYSLPIYYRLNVTVDDGTNPLVSHIIDGWSVSRYPQGWNLLPYPPAEAIHKVDENKVHQPLWHHHELQGSRYSYFVVNHTLPDNATQLLIRADYTCWTQLQRNVTINNVQCCGPDIIEDESTVTDYFLVTNIANSTLGHVNLTIEGYYDTETDPQGQEWVTGGKIRINMTPDLLASLVLSVDNVPLVRHRRPRAEYKRLDYPVKHILYRKATTSGPDTKEYVFDDRYGRESNLPEICRYQICPSNCECPSGNISKPVCKDYTADPPILYYPNEDIRFENCRCPLIEDCYPDPCYPSGLSRTFHEDEGRNDSGGYYDFVYHYPKTLFPVENYIKAPVRDLLHNRLIKIENITLLCGEDASDDKCYQTIRPPRIEDIWCYCNAGGCGDDDWTVDFIVRWRPFELFITHDNSASCTYPTCRVGRYSRGSEPYQQCRGGCNARPNNIPLTGANACNCGISFDADDYYFTFNGIKVCEKGNPPETIATCGYYDGSGYVNLTPYAKFGFNHAHMWAEHTSHCDLGLQGCIRARYFPAEITKNEYLIKFGTKGINDTDFNSMGKLTIFTHLRELDFNFSDAWMHKRNRTWINYVVQSSSGYQMNGTYDPVDRDWNTTESGDLRVGDVVTVTLHLVDEYGHDVSEGNIEITVPNYEDQIVGVWWKNGNKYVTTDSTGRATFTFTMMQESAGVTAHFEGDWNNKPSEVSFVLEPVLESPLLSTEFFFLIIVSLFVIFTYRWFRKKRMDIYSMWQELKGEVEE